MENPVPTQTFDEPPQPPDKKKYLGLSIFAGLLYGFPTLLIGFMVSVALLFMTYVLFDALFPKLTGAENFDTVMKVIISLAALIGIVLAIAAGIASSRTAYRRSNEDGASRQVGYGMLSCAGIGVIGLLVFPVLCYLGYFLIFQLLNIFKLNNSAFAGIITGGSESSFAFILIGCIPSIAIFLAYITAILFGGVAYRRLTKKRG